MRIADVMIQQEVDKRDQRKEVTLKVCDCRSVTEMFDRPFPVLVPVLINTRSRLFGFGFYSTLWFLSLINNKDVQSNDIMDR